MRVWLSSTPSVKSESGYTTNVQLRILTLLCLLILSISSASMAQIVIPTFGTRGDVSDTLLNNFMSAFREEVSNSSGLSVSEGDLITAGIASSLEAQFTFIIAELEDARYAVSGEIRQVNAQTEPVLSTSQDSFIVNILIVDAETERSSDLINQPLDPRNISEAVTELTQAFSMFLEPLSVLQEGSAGLFISSQPDEAQVFINGVSVGETSSLDVLMLAPGRYDIEVRKEGYLPENRRVALVADRMEFVNLSLTAVAGGSIQISSEPKSTVYLDDEALGMTPLIVQSRPGVQVVRLERPGFQPEVLNVTVRNYRVSRIQANLEPAQNPLVFWEEADGYRVYIDDKLQTDGYAKDITPGLHTVRIEKDLTRQEFPVLLLSSGAFKLDVNEKKLIPYQP